MKYACSGCLLLWLLGSLTGISAFCKSAISIFMSITTASAFGPSKIYLTYSQLLKEYKQATAQNKTTEELDHLTSRMDKLWLQLTPSEKEMLKREANS